MVKYSSKTLDHTFAALADPTRRRILAHLAQGDQCVTRLARPHAMSLPAISKHLRVLEKAGLLRRRRYGRVHEMQLAAAPLKQAAKWVVDRFCLIGPVERHLEKLRALRDLGVDQFAVYNMHDAKEATIDAYGEHIVPALG